MNPRTINLVHFLVLIIVSLVSLPELGRADPPYHICSNKTTNATQFQSNLDALFSDLVSDAATSTQSNSTSGKDPYRVYGQYMCFYNFRIEDCATCVEEAKDAIKSGCWRNTEAAERQEKCQIRYSNRDFIGHLNVSFNNLQWNPENISTRPDEFTSAVNETMSKLIERALDPTANLSAKGDSVFTRDDKIYGLVQCTSDLSRDDCRTCLQVAFANASASYPWARGIRVYSFSCYLRYELYNFYGEDDSGSEDPKSGRGKSTILVALAVLLFLICGCTLCWLSMKKMKHKEENQEAQLQRIGDSNYADVVHKHIKRKFGLINSQDSPFMDLVEILAATENFSESNKLGEGGFGPVYRGVLSNGKEVAVKRLSVESEQGHEEFANEVLLIMKLQHKNLVRLIGFFVGGGEKLLVYEFMPNRSLDIILFDRKTRAQLDWSRSMNIIHGIARGILYLHQDSRLRIIHRDLKASNILLDKYMNPKISDFGIARIFEGTEGTINTARVVGTYGYMAPEFAMEGLYSIKSDVFSFGVLLLEIITGRRNMGFHRSQRAPSLIAYAWQLWTQGNSTELMDDLLVGLCPSEEFSRYVHIGLLCVQEDADERPTVSAVVSMLKSKTKALPRPERPAFSVGRFKDHYELAHSISFANETTFTAPFPR